MICMFFFCFLMILRPPSSTLFPYTTLFRSLVASLPLIKERILVIILLLHFLSLMLGSVLVLMLPLLVWLTPDLRITSIRSEERFSRNAETDLVCRLLLEKKKKNNSHGHIKRE